MSLTIVLTLSFLGCSPQTKYIKSKCPKAVTFERDHNVSIFNKKIKLSVPKVDDNLTIHLIDESFVKKTLSKNNPKRYSFLKQGVWGFVNLALLRDLSVFMQELKLRGKEDVVVIELYEKMVKEYNSINK